MQRFYVCPERFLKRQKRVFVTVENREIAVLCMNGRLAAYDAVCLHQGGPLSRGRAVGPWLECPWHGCRWDARTGCLAGSTTVRLKGYSLDVQDGNVYVTVDENL